MRKNGGGGHSVRAARYNQATALLTEAKIAYTEVAGDVQDEVDRLAGVTDLRSRYRPPMSPGLVVRSLTS